MLFNQFDIIKVPFPFTDQQITKKRPALVVSTQGYQQSHHHLMLLMITSAKLSSWCDDINITNYQAVGLPNPSIIRFKLFSLDDRFALGKLGILSSEDQILVKSRLSHHLALN